MNAVPGNAPLTDLRGRTVLLTGASGGIGRALTARCAQAGARLALVYGRSAASAAQAADAARAYGAEVVTLGADLADPAAADRLHDEVRTALGPVDVLISNAGLAIEKPWQQLTADDWNATLAVNLTAPFLLTQLVLPGMIDRGFGRVLYMSSVAGLTGGVIGPHYAASKAGLHGLVHFYAPRVAPHGVTVNAIAPALIGGTGMVPGRPEDRKRLPIPVGRLGTPEEVADLTLAVLRNGYITNQVISVDGGVHPR